MEISVALVWFLQELGKRWGKFKMPMKKATAKVRPFSSAVRRAPVIGGGGGIVGEKYGGVQGPVIKKSTPGPISSPGERKQYEAGRKKYLRV